MATKYLRYFFSAQNFCVVIEKSSVNMNLMSSPVFLDIMI